MRAEAECESSADDLGGDLGGDLGEFHQVSGRSIDKLREWVPADTLYLSGSHGFEIAGPIGSSLNFTVASQLLPEMEQALQLLQQRVSDLPHSPLSFPAPPPCPARHA